jgi:hypothetical protein
VQAYIRFKTPKVSFASLLDPGNARSPLLRVKRRLAEAGGAANGLPRDVMSHEMRLLGCLVRANLRDHAADIRDKIARLDGDPEEHKVLLADVREAIAALLDELKLLLDGFRGVRGECLKAKRPRWLRELYEFIDEHISISAETYLTALISAIDADPTLRRELQATRERLAHAVQLEQQHRRGADYVSVIDPDNGNDAYVYRKSALKKFVSSVLFLEMQKEKEGRGAGNVIAGFAAGIAMLFSTVAAIWSQQVYGLNSFPFVVAIVIAYVFKDRIKEWLRAYFAAKLGRWLYDYNVVIRDPVADAVVGRCRESFVYLAPSRVPKDVVRRRHADATSVLERESKPEIVMKYVKDVTLHGRRIASKHGRLGDVNDIIRYNISSFLARMDEPIRHVETFDAAQDRVRSIACPKSYHVNVVLVLRARGKMVTMERFRIVLDKRGIKRLSAVRTGA